MPWPWRSRCQPCGDPELDALVATYPGSHHRPGCDLEGRQPQPDLERPQCEDLRPNARRSDDPDIKDQFAIPYPLGTALKIPAVNEDPGRIPYNCRPIAQTNRLSIHAYCAVIDLATKFGDYWLWSKGKDGRIAWKNRLPLEIVDIFEGAGFLRGRQVGIPPTRSNLNIDPRSLCSPSKAGPEITGYCLSRRDYCRRDCATVTTAQTPIGCMASTFCIALLTTRRSIGAGGRRKYVP